MRTDEPRRRDSARVLVVDDDGRVLLFEVVDVLDARAAAVWITPGGGVEPGESLAATAARELREETGLDVAPRALGDPVAACRGSWTYRGERLEGVDRFYALRVASFEVRRDGWTTLEREVCRGWRWWSPEELAATTAVVLPHGLGWLVRRLVTGWRPDDGPVELPWREA